MINWFVLSILFLLNDVIFTFYLNAEENSEFHLKIIFNAFGKAAVVSLVGVGFLHFILAIAYELENRKISKNISNLYALILSVFGVTLAFFELEIWNRTIWDEVSYFMISILFVLIFVPVYLISLLLPRSVLNSKNGFKLISKNDANQD